MYLSALSLATVSLFSPSPSSRSFRAASAVLSSWLTSAAWLLLSLLFRRREPRRDNTSTQAMS
jgi:hypothetical protein